ncbi:MAG: hypothetical protein AB7W28_02745 [Armatimonadota bacterium]
MGRGEGIVVGDIAWKVSTLRFAAGAAKTLYQSCERLTDTSTGDRRTRI